MPSDELPGRVRDPQSLGELVALLRSDVEAHRRRSGRVLPNLFPSIFAVAGYRVAHFLRRRGMSLVPRLLTWFVIAVTSCELDPEAVVGPGFQVVHTQGTGIGPQVRAGRDLTLYNGVILGAGALPRGGMPQIGDGVTVYTKASVFGGVTIGDGAVIGAHCLVLSDVPAGATTWIKPSRATAPVEAEHPQPPTTAA